MCNVQMRFTIIISMHEIELKALIRSLLQEQSIYFHFYNYYNSTHPQLAKAIRAEKMGIC